MSEANSVFRYFAASAPVRVAFAFHPPAPSEENSGPPNQGGFPGAPSRLAFAGSESQAPYLKRGILGFRRYREWVYPSGPKMWDGHVLIVRSFCRMLWFIPLWDFHRLFGWQMKRARRSLFDILLAWQDELLINVMRPLNW